MTATDRRTGWRAIVIGAAAVLAALVLGGPPIVPVYDGVVPAEPYRWLHPPTGAPGDPQGAGVALVLADGASPLISVATPEVPPQAQVFAVPGALTLPAGTTSIAITIGAVEPGVQPAAGPTGSVIAGNVYRFSVTNQAGATLTAPADAQVTIALRAPDPAMASATLARLGPGGWQPLATSHTGGFAMFSAIVTDFGDFALLVDQRAATPGGSGTPAPGPTPTPEAGDIDRGTLSLVLGGLAAVLVGALVVLAFLPRRRPRSAAGNARRGSRR